MRAVLFFVVLITVTGCRGEEPKTHAFNRPARPTDTLKSLTLDQVRTFNAGGFGLSHLGGLTSISPDVAQELTKSTDWLYLEGLKTITPEVARALSATPCGLVLNGLVSLPPEVAEQLAKSDKTIYLDGLQSLSVRAAEALASHKGFLSLCGLTTCDDELLNALVAHKGSVRLGGVIKHIAKLTDARLAEMLAKGSVLDAFENLTELSVEAAQALSAHASVLSFPKLKKVSRALAEQLIQTKNQLYLDGVETLERDVADILSQSRGRLPDLMLNGLVEISADTAEALGQKSGLLSLNGLSSLTPQSALALAKHSAGPLFLRGVKWLDEETALALSKSESWIYLGVPELTVTTAKGLAAGNSHRGLTLTNLTGLTADLAKPLVANDKLILELPTLKAEDISPQLSAVFAKAKCSLQLSGINELTSQLARDIGFYSSRLELTNLRTITPEQARLLSGNTGYLEFPLIERLEEETLRELAAQKGTLIFHVKGLSPVLLRGLENHEGTLWLCKPTHEMRRSVSLPYDDGIVVTQDEAVALVKHRGPVVLWDVEWLPDEAAFTFAERAELIGLPDLKSVSPKALKALQSNPKVEMPENVRADGRSVAP